MTGLAIVLVRASPVPVEAHTEGGADIVEIYRAVKHAFLGGVASDTLG